MYEWVIVGGGIHGTFLARSLVVYAGVPTDRIRILDPAPRLCDRWLNRTATLGMQYLRSPSSHNMDIDYRSLRRFAAEKRYDRETHLLEPYARPSLELFNAHVSALILESRLETLHTETRALSIERPSRGHIRIETDHGGLETARVIVATGPQPKRLPAWAEGTPARHVFDSSFPDPTDVGRSERKHPTERIAVMGGGISAWQIACNLRHSGSVSVISSHRIVESMFDSDPCFLGPKCMSGYRAVSAAQREKMLVPARRPGTIPPNLARNVRSLIADKQLSHVVEQIDRAETTAAGVVLECAGGGELGPFDRIICATGFRSGSPDVSLFAPLLESEQLEVTPGGRPVPGSNLVWCKGVYLAGGLAEIELGPTAPNIVGAHKAFRRIMGRYSPLTRDRPPSIPRT